MIDREPDAEAPGVRAFPGDDLVVRYDSSVYFTRHGSPGGSPGKVWLVPAQGEKFVVESDIRFLGGIALSPDQSLLYVGDSRSHWIYSYQIQPDGSLEHKQRFFHLHTPDNADNTNAGGMATDRDGRLWVATNMGVQVCDQAGRVLCILPTPNGRATNLCFGGPEFDTLYVTGGDKVFRRKVKPRGAMGFLPPLKPAGPRL